MSRFAHICRLLAVMALCLVWSCGHHQASTDRAALDAIDSTYQQVQSLDAMQHIVDSLSRDGDKPALMMALKQLGKLCRNNSRFQEAIAAHTRELDIARQLRDTVEMTRALNNLGTNFRRMGILEEATGYHYQALSCCDQYSRQDDPLMLKNRVVSLNGIGNIYMTMGNYQAADSVLRAALAGERTLGSELGQAINLANIGSILEHQGQADSAWTYYRQSLEMNTRAGSQLGISLCHTHFGELYEAAGQLDKAVGEYRQAYDLMRTNSDSWHWMESCAALARVHIKLGDYAQAEKFIALTDSIANAINSLEHQSQASMLKYQLTLKRGDTKQALEHFLEADALEDSLRTTGNSSQMQNARVNYERQRRQAEFDLINKNYENERKLKNIFIIAVVLVIMLAGIAIAFLLSTMRARRRSELLRQQLEQMRSNFFTNVTHEFRTPLTVIMGLSEQMQRSDATPEQARQHAAIIHRQGNNLLQLINQLLDISRVRSEIGEPEWRTGNIVTYVAMLAEAYQVVAQQQGITLQFAAQKTDIVMDLAPYYMRRIVNNLVGNAIKFTGKGGMINVTCGLADDTHMRLNVADTGRGIAPDDLPHIFEAFYTGKAVQQGDMSTGVGLSLVNQIVSAMQGTIVVHSDEGKGTVFTVTLPLKHGDGNWPMLGQETATAIESSVEIALDDDGDDDEACRILVVDDHNDVAYYIGQQLQSLYSVHYASDGNEALSKAEQLVPDLIITDLMMPHMDGYELCRRIRAHRVLNHIPVIMVTARCSDQDRIRGYQLGADAYLEKPFNPDELRMRVATLLDQRQQLRQHFMQELSLAATQAEQAPDDENAIKQQPPVTAGATEAQQPVTRQTEPSQTIEVTQDEQQPFIKVITQGEQEFMRQLVGLVEQAMSDHRVDLEHIASQMAMTSTQLRRKVRAITGQNPLAYINQLRMARAASMLRDEPDMAVADIADRCGYDDLAYFSRQFKQAYDVTPTQYRKQSNG